MAEACFQVTIFKGERLLKEKAAFSVCSVDRGQALFCSQVLCLQAYFPDFLWLCLSLC